VKGTLEYIGRRDSQVKIRGYRVELGEIETALRRQPGVREAVVLLREDMPGDRRIVAYIVPAEAGDPPRADVLQQRLGVCLPTYMIPSAVVVLPELPLTANGKIDRRRLPVVTRERPQFSAAYAAPTTAMECTVARLWREILRIDDVGIHDNFFSLGGDSIAAIQVATRARSSGLAITPLLLFQHQTVAELAAHLDSEEAESGSDTPAAGAVVTPAQLSYLSSRVQLDS